MSELTDRQLADAFRNGDSDSFGVLLKRYQNKVFSYILMHVKNRQQAEDLFQDTFVKIIQTIKSGAYREEGKFLQFAIRIAHNIVMDNFRYGLRIPVTDGPDKEKNIVDDVRIEDGNVEDQMMREQVYVDVAKLVDMLPDDQREVVHMRMYDDFSFKEIADITNVSINTALGRMRYALINLRKMIHEHGLDFSLDV